MLEESVLDRLRCPACTGSLSRAPEVLTCRTCGAAFPVVRGAPVLIDGSKSLFEIDECAATAFPEPRPRRLKRAVRAAMDALAPKVAENLAAEKNLAFLMDRLREESPAARVLVLGGGALGSGMELVVDEPGFSIVESDVVFGPRTNLVCDAHDIPFADGTFDAVIAQGVLEYVIDPFRVADEIHRVLRPGGFAYAESPFMQQVHGGAYDFFRFTYVGHRRLFRKFEEVRSGIVCGPGMALSWSYRYFLRSFVRNLAARALANAIGNLTSAWVSRFDQWMALNMGAFDAASAFYFLGRRSETTLPDRDILAVYRGAWKMHG